MDGGSETVDSVLPPTVVRVVEPFVEAEGKPKFLAFTFNSGEAPYNFGPENITPVLMDGTRLPMATYAQLVREEKGRQRWRAFGLALGAFGRGMQASQEGQFSGTVNSNTGRQVGTFSGTETGSSRTAQMLAEQQTREDAAAVRERNVEEVAALGSILRTTTVESGKVAGGEVRFDWPKVLRKDGTYPVSLEVDAGGVIHRFAAKITKD